MCLIRYRMTKMAFGSFGTMRDKVIVSWSGGKDCILALREILESNAYEVKGLLTTVNTDSDRTSAHGIQSVLLEQQANSLGFHLQKMCVRRHTDNVEYEKKLLRFLGSHRSDGVSAVVFGDIFLEDVKAYRERVLSRVGLRGLFPLWGRSTQTLAHCFIEFGFKAIASVVDSEFLDKDFAGREFDRSFLSDLPSGVDPCGENGEFHTFVYNGPLFHRKVDFAVGKIRLREHRFYFCDLVRI